MADGEIPHSLAHEDLRVWSFLTAVSVMLVVCLFHRSLLSMVMPRNLTEVTRGMMVLLTFSGLSRDHLYFLVNMMAWDLRALSFTPTEVHQLLMVLRKS